MSLEAVVLDASFVAQPVVNDNYTEHTKRFYRQHKDGYLWYIPTFCLLECTNVIWKRTQRAEITAQQGQKAIRHLYFLPLKREESSVYFLSAYDISIAHNTPTYDAVYIAIAQHFDCPLITADSKQADIAQALAVTATPISTF